MDEKEKISTLELINRGWLMVNIPAIVIILLVWFFLANYINLNGKISVIIGGALGWIYWEFFIIKWIKWALNNNVNPDRLLQIGKRSLLLWNSSEIDKVIKKRK